MWVWAQKSCSSSCSDSWSWGRSGCTQSQLTAELEAVSQRPGNEEHSPLLATENAIEPAHSGLLGRDYEMAEGVASHQSSPQEIRV